MKKHCYEITINRLRKREHELVYDYSTTSGRGIKLQVSLNAIRIIANLSTQYDNRDIVASTNKIFSDAIKKALLLHIIIYSQNICISSLSIAIDNKKENVIAGGSSTPPVYSLIVDKLVRQIPQSWQTPVLYQKLLSCTKSNQDTRWAAVFAAICAKSKSFEIERFIYLWMAVNGMYNYLAARIEKLRSSNKNDGKEKRISETDKLRWLLQLYDLGEEPVTRDDAAKVASDVVGILKTVDLNIIKTRSDLSEKLQEEIEKVLLKKDQTKYKLSAYGYLVISFPYFFRCNIVHANKPLPLFCYSDESELKNIKLINELLENFIDKNLPKLFDENYIEKQFGEKIVKIANRKP